MFIKISRYPGDIINFRKNYVYWIAAGGLCLYLLTKERERERESYQVTSKQVELRMKIP
jgi:hypothetical protein